MCFVGFLRAKSSFYQQSNLWAGYLPYSMKHNVIMKIFDNLLRQVFPGHDITWQERFVILGMFACISIGVIFGLK
jgi:hypothetical protein